MPWFIEIGPKLTEILPKKKVPGIGRGVPGGLPPAGDLDHENRKFRPQKALYPIDVGYLSDAEFHARHAYGLGLAIGGLWIELFKGKGDRP